MLPKPKVLLIEQDPKQTEIYTDLIREVVDCQLDVISEPGSSLNWMGKFNYHLVVIDTGCAEEVGVDALEVLEKIRRLSPVTSVILISENATVDRAVAAIRLGAEDYLKKPFNLESFQLAVKRGLDRKTVFGTNSGLSSYLNLMNSCQMISASLEQGKILDIVQSFFTRELSSDHCAIYRLSPKGEVSRVEDASNGVQQDRAVLEVLDIALQASNPLPNMVEANDFYRFIDRGQLTPALFVFRFQCVDNMDYFCVCMSPKQPRSLEIFESQLRMLKTQIEVTGKNIEQYQGIQSLIFVDDATGLYNTRYLHTILERELAQAQLSQKSFAVLFLDADHFKQVNDTHGHLVGTKLLNELGNQLKRYVRESDTVFRYGGDEFVAVLSPCDLMTAQAVAERIRQSIEEHPFISEEGLNLHITVSIGVALFPDHASTKRAIIDAADRAMYGAKKRSRNSVVIADLSDEDAGSVHA